MTCTEFTKAVEVEEQVHRLEVPRLKNNLKFQCQCNPARHNTGHIAAVESLAIL